jgi:dTDP-4-amino-4,6-dideoxygalactose transaminase
VNLGARPIFVDIEARGYLMDPQKLEFFLQHECDSTGTDRQLVHKQSGAVVKALLVVHLFGQSADMDAITRIARRYNLPVVEDACQALGATYKEKYAGSLGDLGCFSFFPSKNLGGAGDGGMVITSDPQLADRVRLLRTHGESSRYHHSIVGYNSRLDELQAAVLRVKLPYLDSWSAARRKNASDYARYFAEHDLSGFVEAPHVFDDRSHIYHQYVIRCRKRDALRDFLKGRGVDTQIYYPVSLHEQECFSRLGYRSEDLPESLAASRQTLALPVYPELTEQQKRYVAGSIADFYRS